VVALIQEHWVHEDKIKGLCHKWGNLFSGGPSIAPRTCLFVRNSIQAFPLLELSSRDVTTVTWSFIIYIFEVPPLAFLAMGQLSKSTEFISEARLSIGQILLHQLYGDHEGGGHLKHGLRTREEGCGIVCISKVLCLVQIHMPIWQQKTLHTHLTTDWILFLLNKLQGCEAWLTPRPSGPLLHTVVLWTNSNALFNNAVTLMTYVYVEKQY
jgi:hypothetical protein